MANKKTKKTKKNPTTVKTKKPGWIRACFGLGPAHESRMVKDQLPGEGEVTRGGGKRRKLGLRILREVKRPWCKKKEDKTTSFSDVKVVGIQKSLLLLLDDGSHEVQGPIESQIQKEFDIIKDISISKKHSKPIIEDTSDDQQETKISKPIVEEEDHTKLKKVASSNRVALPKQSSLKNAKRSDKDSLIGMSIFIIVLVIMLLCGRICAILFTSIWFYCMPQLIKTATKSNKDIVEGGKSSVKSEIERKKVMLLIGFLERKGNIFC